MKRMSKQLNSENGLMLKKTFDITTSFYGNGKENKPYIAVNTKGDFKISLFKLFVILTLALSTFALIALCAKNFTDYCHAVKPRRISKRAKYRDEDWV